MMIDDLSMETENFDFTFRNSRHMADIDWSQSFHYLLNVVKRNIGSDFLILSDGERRRILKGLIPSLKKSSVLIFYSTQIGCLKLSANC